MFKTILRTPKLTKIACVSPRIYQTITQTLKRFLQSLYRPLIRVKRSSLTRDKSLTKPLENVKGSYSSDGIWSHWFSYREPKGPTSLWTYVKTPEEYLEEPSKETEIRLQNLLFK